MIGYTMTYAMRKTLGYQVYMESQTLANLQYYFEDIYDIQPTEMLCPDIDDPKSTVPWETFLTQVPFLTRDDYKIGNAIELPIKVGNNTLV